MAGYHLKNIPRGEIGKFSKIEEEFLEFLDAVEQKSTVMALVELSDLVGSIKYYLKENGYSNNFPDLIKHSRYLYHNLDEVKESFDLLKQQKIDLDLYKDFFLVLHGYVKNYNMGLEDLVIMSTITERVFLNGHRTSRTI